MNRVRKFLRLSPLERALLIKAFVLLAAIRLGFSLLSFDSLRRKIARLERRNRIPPRSDSELTGKIIRAVAVAAKYVPGARTCLMQALAAKVLLARRGLPAKLHIGVARDEAGDFAAHAWIESDGAVILGGSEDLSRYTRLPPIEQEEQ